MPKTQEELKQLKNEYESLRVRLKELNEDELKQVTGGSVWYDIDNPEGGLEPGSRLVGKGKEHDEQIIND